MTDQQHTNLPKSFHDDALNITYFYPPHFEQAPSAAGANGNALSTNCVQTKLIANSGIPAGPSTFILSTIDDTCPEALREASSLGPFTRAQILRQLKQYGEPTISREPFRYMIDGHSAAISLASVQASSESDHARTIYAAKACALGSIPVRRHKKSDPAGPVSRVLCFDFTTQNRDLLDTMFSFIIQFDNDPPAPLFPGTFRRSKY
jgi:hypothetical protein